MSDYSKFIEKMKEKPENEEHIKKLTEIIQQHKDIYCFAVNSLDAQQFNTKIAAPIKEKLVKPTAGVYQIYITDIKKIKYLFQCYQSISSFELIRGDKSKLFFDLDCDFPEDEYKLVNSFKLINEIKELFKTQITGIIEYPKEENIKNIKELIDFEHNPGLILKNNPNKKKFCSCHLFIKGYSFYRNDLVSLFKPLFNKLQKDNGLFGKVFDCSIYKQNASQQPFRASMFVKPGKRDQMAIYTTEELNIIINNILDYLAQCSSNDILITDMKDLTNIINKYVVQVKQIPTKNKKQYEEILNKQIDNYVEWIGKHPKVFSDHVQWVHSLVKYMELYINKRGLTNDTEENRKILFDVFKDPKYQYYSKSQGQKLFQPTSIKWAIDKAYTKDFIKECFYNHEITIDFREFIDKKNKTLSFQEFAYLFNHTFVFFKKFDLLQNVIIKENGRYLMKPLQKLVNQPDEIYFNIVFKNEEEVLSMCLTFKQCCKTFEYFKNKFDDLTVYSTEPNTFSLYNLPITTLTQTTVLNEYIDNVLNLFCNYDENRKNYILDWLAFALQYPDKRNHTALQIRTTQGTGKNLVFNIINDFYKDFSNLNAKVEDIDANFNTPVINKKFIIFNECSKRKKNIEALKSFITENSISAREKYINEYQTLNLANVVILTNNFETYTIEDNDRRITYLTSDLQPHEKSFYDECFDEYDEVKKNFIDFLLSRDLSNYSPDKTYSDDDKKKIYEQRNLQRHVIFRLIEYIFTDKEVKEITINDLIKKIYNISFNDETITDERLMKEIKSEYKYEQQIDTINVKMLNNILNYSQSDKFYLDFDVVKRKITNFNDLYEYIDKINKISLNDLKKSFPYLTNNNYKNILKNYDIKKVNDGIQIITRNYDKIYKYIEENKEVSLKELKEKYDVITKTNYRVILKNYEIKKNKKGIIIKVKDEDNE